MTAIRHLALPVLLAAIVPAIGHADERVPLVQALRRADTIVIASVDDPSTDQTVLPVRGAPPFVRLQWRLRVHEVLLGKIPRGGVLLRADEAGWRGDLEAHRRCQGRQPCAAPPKDGYASQLSRPPRPGQTVLALLRRTRDGHELALERAMDAPEKAAEVRALLRRAR